MAFRRPTPPTESDLLCESCGYLLNGLEGRAGALCPECGEPLATSLDPTYRKPAPIELAWTRRNFWLTTWRVIADKRRFFRETLTRTDSANVPRFGHVHRLTASVLFGVAAATHAYYMVEVRGWNSGAGPYIGGAFGIVQLGYVALVPASAASAALLLAGVTRLAIAATATESRFWGMRLPRRALTRAMDFHAANYLPVGVLAVLVTVGYRALLMTGVVDARTGVAYLVALSLAVVASAVWLFESFVIAMRRIRLANF